MKININGAKYNTEISTNSSIHQKEPAIQLVYWKRPAIRLVFFEEMAILAHIPKMCFEEMAILAHITKIYVEGTIILARVPKRHVCIFWRRRGLEIWSKLAAVLEIRRAAF